MLVNFLHHLFQTKVECSAVSSDGYSPQNLISSCWRERNQGFMAAHFIKPPVILLVQFPLPIQVHSLVIKPKVGSQISTGIDVHVAGVKPELMQDNGPSKTQRKRTRREMTNATLHQKQHSESLDNDSAKGGTSKSKRRRIDLKNSVVDEGKEELPKITKNENKNIHVSKSIPNPICNYSTLITTDSFKADHRYLFTLVSRTNEQHGRTIRIVNRRYKGSQMSCIEEDIGECEFFQAHALGYVTHLVICINRMKGSCVPALGKVEVWGQPSPSCTKNIIDYALDIQKQIMKNATSVPATETRTKPNCKQTVYKEEAIDDDETPSDFIDPITCKLMTIPMLLPSGLSIDMTTLEKHTEAERQWGRLPSDPFTGVLFTSSMKPLPNSALKARIDKYILSSGIDVNNFGRTVGRSSSSHQADTHTCLSSKGTGIRKRKQIEAKEKSNHEAKNGIENVGNYSDQSVSKTDYLESQNRVTQTHEDKVSQSLDTALMKTLQGATFTRKKMPTVNINVSSSSLIKNNDATTATHSLSSSGNSQGSSNCVGCKVSLETAFQLPCQHLICRKCLLLKTSSNKNATCSLCEQTFGHKEVIRVHTI